MSKRKKMILKKKENNIKKERKIGMEAIIDEIDLQVVKLLWPYLISHQVLYKTFPNPNKIASDINWLIL